MTWKNITIEKYDRIAALQSENMGEIDLIAAVIAVLDETTVEKVEELPYAVLLMKARNLRFLQSSPIASIVHKSYELNGKKYIPTLNPAELTTAQYIDFQVRAADAPEDLAGLLSVLLIPEGHKYNEGYSGDEVRETIYKYLPIEDAMGLSAFFFILWKKSISRLLRENRRQYRKLRRKKDRTKEETELMTAIKNLIETIEQVQNYL